MNPSASAPNTSGALQPLSGTTRRLAIWLFLLVTLKSIFLGSFVIPPADIPDESGHYAYVKDIARGNIFPLLGQATIPNDLWMDPVTKDAGPSTRTNYIVQHPPLYYAIAAIPYKIASLITDDRWYHIRATRLVSALCLGLLVVVLFRTMLDMRVDPAKAVLLAMSVAFIPTLTNLSAGITNDVFLALVSAMATRHFIRYLLDHRLQDAYLCALWLTVAGATKMTAWIMIAAMVAILLFELRLPWRRWLLHAPLISLVSVLAPLWWMGRNLYHFGNPFYIGITDSVKAALPHLTVEQFIHADSFFYPMLVSFYGLFGFSGYCQTPELAHLCIGTRLTHITDYPFLYFALVILVLALAFLWLTVVHGRQLAQPSAPLHPAATLQEWMTNLLSNRALRVVLIVSAAIAGTAAYLWVWPQLHLEEGLREEPFINAILLIPLILGPTALVLAVLSREPSDRLVHYGLLVFVFFGLIFLTQVFKAYVLVAQMRGIQGRYFYPYVPLLLASSALVLEKLRVPPHAYLWAVLGLAVADIYTYAQKVIPFLETVKI